MQFAQVIEQEALKEKLRGLSDHNRISHALLFVAREGTGGLPLALAFAQYLVCEKVNHKQDSNKPSLFGPTPQIVQTTQTDSCGVCPACKKASEFAHPDIHYSYPTVTSKGVDKPKAVDFIVSWREFLREQPYGNSFDWIERIKEKENSQGKITSRECDDIIRKLSLKSFRKKNLDKLWKKYMNYNS